MNFSKQLLVLGLVGAASAEITATPENCDECDIASLVENPIADQDGLKALVDAVKECPEDCSVTLEGTLSLTNACKDATDLFGFDVSEVPLELDYSKLTFEEDLTCTDDVTAAKDLNDPCELSSSPDVTATVSGANVTLDPATFEKNFQIGCAGIGAKAAAVPVSKTLTGGAGPAPGPDADTTSTEPESESSSSEADDSTSTEDQGDDGSTKGARSVIAATGTAAIFIAASLL